MTALRLGPVIGRIGGAKIEAREVSRSGMVGPGEMHEIFAVDVPEGKAYMVVVSGTMTYDGREQSSTPQLRIGSKTASMTSTDPQILDLGCLAGPGTTSITVESRAQQTDASFDGTVYWLEIDA